MMAAEQRADSWTLGELFPDAFAADHAAPVDWAATAIDDISLDSRSIRPGSLFLACPGSPTAGGASRHGLEFATDALQNGAAAIAWEPTAPATDADVPDGIPAIRIPDLSQRLGALADRFFGEPSLALRVIGVTGTNGKTTCTWLLANALERMGQPAGLIGTLGHGSVDAIEPGALTTPDCVAVHRQLAQLRRQGATSVAMEVSSHALDQDRISGVRLNASVFTNLSRDHLDYHGSESAYAEAKSRLFSIPNQQLAVICASDEFGRSLLDRAKANRVIAVCDNDQELPEHVSVLRVRGEDTGGEGIAIRFDGDFGSGVFQSRLVGQFNIMNLGLVLALLLGSGYAQTKVLPAMEALTAPPGRMEMLTSADAPLVVVDYAHTPDALRQALIALRAICRGTLWCVFGCGGERDTGKRSLMANVAAENADRIVVTDDNPRTEDGDRIVADIVAGFPEQTHYVVERERKAAIAHAIDNSVRGDCVLVAGKGHEDYQIVGTERRHFSDRETVAALLGVNLADGLGVAT